MNGLRVIAHRGIRGPYVENSLASFAAALKTNADAVEFDIQSTKDGQLVVLHSMGSPRKIFGIKQPINALSWADIQKYKNSAGERIPSFAEVLNILKSKPVDIDIKDVESAKILTQSITVEQARHIAIVNSLHVEALRIVQRKFPDVAVSLQNYKHPLKAIKLAKQEGFTHVTLPRYLLNPYTYWRALRANLGILIYQNYASFLLSSRLYTRILRLKYPFITIVSDRADKIC